jgi:hypothetical protein
VAAALGVPRPLHFKTQETNVKSSSTNQRLTALVAVLAVVTAAVAAHFALPAGVTEAEASQPVHARVTRDILNVKGTRGDDKLVLRLRTGDPNVLEIDVGDNGTSDFSFDRNRSTRSRLTPATATTWYGWTN